jgi:hypothetical protein
MSEKRPSAHSTTAPAWSDLRHEEHFMIITTTTWPGTSVVQPAIERPTAMRLAQIEYRRVTDAADFCRVISDRPGSDRGQPWGLLATRVPF